MAAHFFDIRLADTQLTTQSYAEFRPLTADVLPSPPPHLEQADGN